MHPSHLLAALSLTAVFAMAASAQAPRREPAVNDTQQSPEVSSDHHVTFRIFAPKASEVTLTGDWLGATPAPKLSQDEHGVWSVTLGPFEPSIYIYSFNVDGVAIPDPVNPRIKLRARTSASMVEVKDDTPAFWEPRDVPHGAVEINWEKSHRFINTLTYPVVLSRVGLQACHRAEGALCTQAGWRPTLQPPESTGKYVAVIPNVST